MSARNGGPSLTRRRGEALQDARGFKRRARGIPLILVLVAFVYNAMNDSPFVGPDLLALSGSVIDKDESPRDSRVSTQQTKDKISAFHSSYVSSANAIEQDPSEAMAPTAHDQIITEPTSRATDIITKLTDMTEAQREETEKPITSEEAVPTHNNNAQPAKKNPFVDGWPEQCSLYLAPSTIPNSGLGMYTAVDLDQGDNIGPADIIVPMINIEWHNDNTYKGWDNPESRTNGFHFLYENYVWMASAVDMMHEAERVHVMSHGFGALANSLPGLVNLDEGMPDYNGGGLHRAKDPGAGAFTPYHNRQATALEPVPAGGELFADYGSNWFKSRTNMIGYIPLSEDFDEADALLKKFEAFASQPPRWDKQLETLKNDFIGLIRNFSEVKFEAFASAPGWGDISQETKNDFLGLIRSFSDESRILNALPSSTADLDLAISKGTRELKREIKSPEWLKENGKCMDNLRPLPSTISQAGRGAFATRFLAEGSLVVTAPLIQVPRARDVFRQYAYNLTASGEWIRDPERPAGYQLMMNYCFGHPDSTMMFSPYGPSVSFVNHDRERANVRLEWSDPDHEWLSRSVDQMESTYNAQLSFDLIATRDIEAGEEVFLDYGVEWQAAWDEYVEGWSAPAGSEHFIDADDMNSNKEHELLRTMTEQEMDPYPANVMTRCRFYSSSSDKGWDNPVKEPLLYQLPWKSGYSKSQHHPCTIVQRRRESEASGDFLYTVLIHPVQESTLGKWGEESYRQGGLPKGKTAMIIDMPRNAIEFQSRRYQRDFHLASAFRHEIVVPDELFSKSWRNLAKD